MAESGRGNVHVQVVTRCRVADARGWQRTMRAALFILSARSTSRRPQTNRFRVAALTGSAGVPAPGADGAGATGSVEAIARRRWKGKGASVVIEG